MHKQLLLFHNAIAAYFSGNATLLEATIKQFSVSFSYKDKSFKKLFRKFKKLIFFNLFSCFLDQKSKFNQRLLVRAVKWCKDGDRRRLYFRIDKCIYQRIACEGQKDKKSHFGISTLLKITKKKGQKSID